MEISSFFFIRMFCCQLSKRIINLSLWFRVTEHHIMRHIELVFQRILLILQTLVWSGRSSGLCIHYFAQSRKQSWCKKEEMHVRKLAKMQHTALSFSFFPPAIDIFCLRTTILWLFATNLTDHVFLPVADTHNLISSALATTSYNFFL